MITCNLLSYNQHDAKLHFLRALRAFAEERCYQAGCACYDELITNAEYARIYDETYVVCDRHNAYEKYHRENFYLSASSQR